MSEKVKARAAVDLYWAAELKQERRLYVCLVCVGRAVRDVAKPLQRMVPAHQHTLREGVLMLALTPCRKSQAGAINHSRG
eukprot:3941156-Rhodomonas_salina.6